MSLSPFVPMGYSAKVVLDGTASINQGEWSFPCVPVTLSGCIVKGFGDDLSDFRQNGYFLYDAPSPLIERAATEKVALSSLRLLYAEVYPRNFSASGQDLGDLQPDPTLTTAVQPPVKKTLLGYEIVNFFAGNLPECSYLSCNAMYREIAGLNEFLLFPDWQAAHDLLQSGFFSHCEPGPTRLIALYDTAWPE